MVNDLPLSFLTKREYFQRIIAPRQRFTNVLRLIQFVSTLYAKSKTSLGFLEELLESLTRITQAPVADAARLQTLHQQVAIAEGESRELLTLLDGLMQSFVQE